MNWILWIPQIFFVASSIVSIPLYLIILNSILRNRDSKKYSSPFYTLIVSQGIADIISTLLYFLLGTLRLTALDVFYWKFQYLELAQFQHKQIHFFLFMRCIAFVIISIQRCTCICYTGCIMDRLFHSVPSYILFLLHWSTAFVFSLPILLITGIVYEYRNGNLDLIMPAESMQISAMVKNVFLLGTFPICLTCYVLIYRTIKKRSSSSHDRLLYRERVILMQTVGLAAGYLVIFGYYAAEFALTLFTNINEIITLRRFLPIALTIFTFVTPWSLFFLNKQIQKSVLRTLRVEHCEEKMPFRSKMERSSRRTVDGLLIHL